MVKRGAPFPPLALPPHCSFPISLWEAALQPTLTAVAALYAAASSPRLPTAFHSACCPHFDLFCMLLPSMMLSLSPCYPSLSVSRSRPSCLPSKASALLLCLVSTFNAFVLLTLSTPVFWSFSTDPAAVRANTARACTQQHFPPSF